MDKYLKVLKGGIRHSWLKNGLK